MQTHVSEVRATIGAPCWGRFFGPQLCIQGSAGCPEAAHCQRPELAVQSLSRTTADQQSSACLQAFPTDPKNASLADTAIADAILSWIVYRVGKRSRQMRRVACCECRSRPVGSFARYRCAALRFQFFSFNYHFLLPAMSAEASMGAERLVFVPTERTQFGSALRRKAANAEKS